MLNEIHILGTAPSIKLYKNIEGKITIGVNDIWKYYPADYIVLLDKISTFDLDRFETIKNSHPIKLFSSLDEWKRVFTDMVKINLKDDPGIINADDLDSDKYIYSVDSTFTAVQVAYKLGAQRIVLHGVDIFGHHLEQHRNVILRTYLNLYVALRDRKVELFVKYNTSLLAEVLPFTDHNFDIPGDYTKKIVEVKKPRLTPKFYQFWQQEKEKYSQIWKAQNYASGSIYDFAEYVVKTTEHNGIFLEIGCGDGTLCQLLRRKFRFILGLDITLDGIKNLEQTEDLYREAPAWQTEFGFTQFAYTISTDVLEHIPPEMIDETIKEIFRITERKTIHCISCVPAVKKYQGHEVHLTVKPIEWWIEQFERLQPTDRKVEIDIFDVSELSRKLLQLHTNPAEL